MHLHQKSPPKKQKVVIKEELWKCDKCDKRFFSTVELNKHFSIVHEEKNKLFEVSSDLENNRPKKNRHTKEDQISNEPNLTRWVSFLILNNCQQHRKNCIYVMI